MSINFGYHLIRMAVVIDAGIKGNGGSFRPIVPSGEGRINLAPGVFGSFIKGLIFWHPDSQVKN